MLLFASRLTLQSTLFHEPSNRFQKPLLVCRISGYGRCRIPMQGTSPIIPSLRVLPVSPTATILVLTLCDPFVL